MYDFFLFGSVCQIVFCSPSKTMPILTVFTNLEKASISKDFVKEAAKSVAQAADKTKEDIWVCVVPDLVMGISSDSTPCARCELMVIGLLGKQVDPIISKAICDVISAKLSIGDNRVTINFCDRAAYEVGHRDTTVQVLQSEAK